MKTREDMHRRAQRAEGRLKRAQWWIDAGLHQAKQEAEKDKCWPRSVPRFYLEEAKRELES